MDYMKGYNSRNSRRRSSYQRRRASNQRRRASYKRRHRRPGNDIFFILKWAVPAVLFVVVVFVVFYFWQKGKNEPAKLAATAASVEAVQTVADPVASPTEDSGKVSDAVKEVGALSADSIVKPTPAPECVSKVLFSLE